MKTHLNVIVLMFFCSTVCAFAQEKPIKYVNGIKASGNNNTGYVKSNGCDTIPLFETQGMFPTGLAWDGHFLWISDADEAYIYLYDTLGVIHKTFFYTVNNMTFGGGYLWGVLEQQALLEKIDTATGGTVVQFHLPSYGQSDPNGWGLTWDGQNLWHSEYGDTTKIYKLKPLDGSVITSFAIPSVSIISLAWVDPFLYGVSIQRQKMYKINPVTGLLADSIDWCITYPLGLAWNNTYFWNVSSTKIFGGKQKLYKIYADSLMFSYTGSLKIQNLKIYPNPVIDNIIIETSSLRTQRNLVIYNVAGEEMLNIPMTGLKMSVNLSYLDDGVYIIKLTGVTGVETGRIIKIRGR